MAAPQGVNFDGTNDYLTRGAGLTGAADSKLFTGSLWLRDAASGTQTIWHSDGSALFIRLSNGQISLLAENSSGTIILNVLSGVGDLDDGQWHHVCFCVDMAAQANTFVFADDVDITGTPFTFTDDIIDFTRTNHAVGATTTGSTKLNSDLADFWLAPGVYIDLSVEANRRKFIGASAASSVDLGSDGSTPTGSAPLVFFSGATADWHTNKGTGEGFTENGALTDASANPPDYGGGGGGGINRAVALYHARHHNRAA